MKNFILDVDGVMTTGQFLYSEKGKVYKIFGAHDSDGLKLLKNKIKIKFITADRRGFLITKKRIQEDMGYELELVSEESRLDYMKRNFNLNETIFMGDGIHDAPIIKECAFGITPQNARKEAKILADFVTESNSAEGAVCDACIEINKRFFSETNESIKITKIDSTPRYIFEKWEYNNPETDFIKSTNLRTTFIHKGEAELEIKNSFTSEKVLLKKGQGFITIPNEEYKLTNISKDFVALSTHSEVPEGFLIKEIIDEGYTKTEMPLTTFKIIKNPKRVSKPWGGELWISWTNLHVLKQIWMTAGNQCSLQYHINKLETNYLTEGEADVIDGIEIDLTKPREEINKEVLSLNLNDYKERRKPGQFWTSKKGIVHRVISVTDYIAYETSTPELDDVERISDDSGRQSGRIVSEHLGGDLNV
ncbi:MAG: HAD hydrolase family protein [Nanoarchaeota archaeon]|nr:HAD hydrolase family protein [Nanoarchaeota archaeon]